MLPTFKETFQELKRQLGKIYPPGEAEVIAEMVTRQVSGMSRSERICYPDRILSERQRQQWLRYEGELLQHRPVQYVLGTADFYGLSLSVDESVLIPRPETEELVREVLAGLPPGAGEGLCLLDVGTGSGCIALALKKQQAAATVFAADCSVKALATAQKNARENRLEVTFLLWDLLKDPVPDVLPPLDVLVSNPPYITLEEQDGLAPHVRDYEPHEALFVTDSDPLQFYKKIERVGRVALKPEGRIYLELHERFAPEVFAFFRQKGWPSRLKKDMQGKDRILVAAREA